jgi:hypothetical protein
MDVTFGGDTGYLSSALAGPRQDISGSAGRPQAGRDEPEVPMVGPGGTLKPGTEDRVELSKSGLLYYSSQQISYQNQALVKRADGSYFYRETSLEARQDITISINLQGIDPAGIDLEEVADQLEQIIRDLQEGFRNSLDKMIEDLRSFNQAPGPENLPEQAQGQPVGPSGIPPGLALDPPRMANSGNTTAERPRESLRNIPATEALRNFRIETPDSEKSDPFGNLGDILSADDKKLFSEYLALIRQLAGDDSRAGKLTLQMEQMLEIREEFSLQMVSAPGGQMLQMAYSRMEVASSRVTIEASGGEAVQEGEPLVLDLDGDGIDLRSVDNPVLFDIDNDGRAEATAFVTGDDALLALDKNGNGRIDGVAELFGDKTGAKNGFEDLARYDENRDGRIDSKDSVFNDLLLFQDKNGNGRSDPGELRSLAEEGIVGLSLSARPDPQEVAGNRITETAAYERADGSKGTIAEVYFKYREVV